jgi:Single-strand binding protein family
MVSDAQTEGTFSIPLLEQARTALSRKRRNKSCISVTIVGFVGADPEQRQARNNSSKFTVLSVATQRSWKNAEDEWVSKVEWHRVAIWTLTSGQPDDTFLAQKGLVFP